MMLPIAPSNGQRVYVITLSILLFVFPNIATTIASGKSPVFLPTAIQNKARINLSLRSDAIAGMGTAKAPVKFTVTITNAGNEAVSGMLGWSVKSTAISVKPIPGQAITIDAGKTKQVTQTITFPQAGLLK
jgi:hypothetical protein